MPKKSAGRSAKKAAKKSARGSKTTAKSAAKRGALLRGAGRAKRTSAKQPAKKVASKAAKKVAKKAAKKVAAKHAERHDLRRAYEHLHRLGAIHQQLDPEALAQVEILSELAQAALMEDDPRSAADLLRAAEHLAFGSLALDTEDIHAGEDLLDAAQREFEALSGRAAERWADRDEEAFAELAPVYAAMREAAEIAFHVRALHRALEYARGAEALTQAQPQPRRTPAAKQEPEKRLRGEAS